MPATYISVLEDALQLPIGDRSRIASRFIESVKDADEAETSEAWRTEIGHRMESIRHGTARLIPHDEVMIVVRRKLAARTAAKSA